MARSPKSDWLTIEEAALTLGVGLGTIRRLIAEQKLSARKKGRRWRISATAVCVFVNGGGELMTVPSRFAPSGQR